MRRVPHPFRAFCGMGGNQSAPVSPRPTAGGPPEGENENSPGCSPPRRTKPWDSKPIREGRRPEGQPRFSAAPTASPIFRAPECVSMRSNHAEIRAKCVENTSQNGCFAYEWTLSNRTFRIHPPPPNPAFSLHQHLSRRSSLSSRRIRTIRSVPQPQISTKSRNPSTQRLINVHGSLSTVH